MPSQTKEDYLKALFYLHQKQHAISVTDLGKEMNLSKPTVNNMVKKLQDLGWVKYEKYKPITLTRKGLREAAIIVRKHRLAEMFLTKLMGFGWEEVHEMAEEIEHIKSDDFFERMDELLGFPTRDPHGSPIPDKDGNLHKSDYTLLANVEVGEAVVVRALRESSKEFILFLNKHDISLGTELKVIQKEPFDNSMTVTYKGHQKKLLSHTVTKGLLVTGSV